MWVHRRVGKTALTTHFARDKRMVFYTGAGGTAEMELSGFSEEAASLSTPERNLTEHPFRDWRDALRFLFARADEAPLRRASRARRPNPPLDRQWGDR